MNLTRNLIALALLAASTAVLAHGEKPHAKARRAPQNGAKRLGHWRRRQQRSSAR
jgi:hypothetical protein